MRLNPYFKKRFITTQSKWFLVQYQVILLFLIYKCFHLHLSPYYDESWVYYPAIKCLEMEGLEAIFSGKCVSWTRGHPLFFHLLALLWAKIFGISILSMHSFALTISIGLLVFIRYSLSEFLKPLTVLSILMLVCLQSIFIIQSSMLLPEVLLCFLLYASFYYYYRKNYILFTVCFVFACLTKEIAIIYLPGILLVSLFNRGDKKNLVVTLKCMAIIIAIWLAYLGLEHVLHGWYVYPDHANTINIKFKTIADNWNYLLSYVFGFQGRWYTVIFLAILLQLNRTVHSVTMILVICCLYTIIRYHKSMNAEIFLATTIVLFLILVFIIQSLSRDSGFFMLLLGSIFISTFFFSFSFFTMRYVLPAVLSLVIIALSLIFESSKIADYIRIPALLALIGIYVIDLRNNQKMGDTDMGAIQAMQAQQSMYHYLDQNIHHKINVCTNSFLIWCELGGKYDYYNPPPIDSHFMGYHHSCQTYIYSNIEGQDINPYDSIKSTHTEIIQNGEALIKITMK